MLFNFIQTMKSFTIFSTFVAVALAGKALEYDSFRSSHEPTLYVYDSGEVSFVPKANAKYTTLYPVINDDGQLADDLRKKYVVVNKELGQWHLLKDKGEGKWGRNGDALDHYTLDDVQLVTSRCIEGDKSYMASIPEGDERFWKSDSKTKCSAQSIRAYSAKDYSDVKIDDKEHFDDPNPNFP